MNRYSKNKNMLSDAECDLLGTLKICVVGCGGLGGYVIEMLARLGVGTLTVVDGDVFDVTNLNRQLLSSEENIGHSKAQSAAQRIRHINSETQVHVISEFITHENAESILSHHHVVVDALDTITSRLMLEEVCESLNIPLVHGAIAGWYGQVAVVLPGDKLLSKIYAPDHQRGVETNLGNPSFTPALVASLQVSETLKLILKRGAHLNGELLLIDLFDNDFEIIKL